MHKLFLIISSISGMLSVALGAFGAHALKDKLQSDGTLDTYQTAVQYQFYHTLALLAITLLMTKYESQWLNYAGYSMTFGILIFSGSLYVLCFTGMKWMGAITPIGGLLFIAGWLFLLLTALKSM
ncbi:DUF423 domain-containing protein [Ekhidna sp.]|jgi:uncharacterized membrane protein YgdD (TMEM256/DUF423 family)|uniref:DUF423 domain-containing protein n=1 Tax=Ekhidna sp. TaxID=2608089 RepID=UPI0032EB955C